MSNGNRSRTHKRNQAHLWMQKQHCGHTKIRAERLGCETGDALWFVRSAGQRPPAGHKFFIVTTHACPEPPSQRHCATSIRTPSRAAHLPHASPVTVAAQSDFAHATTGTRPPHPTRHCRFGRAGSRCGNATNRTGPRNRQGHHAHKVAASSSDSQ
jgi:hypothetical protein